MIKKHNEVDPAPEWMSEEALHTLGKGYLLTGETPKDMWLRAAKCAHKRHVKMGWKEDFNLEEELFHLMYMGWLGLASPVASNMGTNRGKPVSCYSINVDDSISSIYSHKKELARLSQEGGGVGVYLGNLRPSGAKISRGGTSTGLLPWAVEYDVTARTVNQGGVRRGSIALYVPIDHPDLKELLLAKDHSQGDPRLFLDSNLAVTITDEWMESMISGDQAKFEIFSEVIRTRMKCGSPYILFTDTVNRLSPECYKRRGLDVQMSNLCSEIMLHTDENHSFVCVLSSLNLSKYDEWVGWRSPSGKSVPELAIWLLEAVVEEFIVKSDGEVGMGRAVRFAKKSRALGLGTMGLHSLYQKRMMPFQSEEARALNIEAHSFVQKQAEKASRELAEMYGEPLWCEGHGIRHTHLTAIAPTKTNSVISGVFSQGIEPVYMNAFVAVQAKGDYIRKNPELEKLFDRKGVNDTSKVWASIVQNRGSVQHLDFLSPEEKEVFKTAFEIEQKEIIKQTSDITKIIDQGISTNIFGTKDVTAKYLLELHILAWKLGNKSLYYYKSESHMVRDEGSKAYIITKDNCPYCKKLKEELKIEYTEVPYKEAKRRGYLREDWNTVPQLWIDGQFIGGYSEYIHSRGGSTEESTEGECVACEG